MIEKTTAIIQARMGSARLPGKVLGDILGKPMLWHLINRVKKSVFIEKIVVATSIKEKDIPVIEAAKKSGVDFFAGSEDDVLDRFYRAAKFFNADPIVRITADCPLIDPVVIDKVIRHYLDNRGKVDYVCNAMPPTYPDGLDVEIFSFNVLERSWKEAKKKTEREYLTMYLHNNKNSFRLANISNNKDFSHMRWTVDEKKDFTFVTEIYKGLYKNENDIFYMEDIVDFLEANPELMKINQGIERNEGYIKSLKMEGADIEKENLPWEPED